jgi:NosR/NirI family nitrous oxide reductase transcriptional regulator
MFKHPAHLACLICLFSLWLASPRAHSETITSAGYDISNYAGELNTLVLELFPSATRLEQPSEALPVWRAYQLDQLLGYAFESIKFADLAGFAGDSINILVGLDVQGNFTGARFLQHSEPIFLHGLGPEPFIEFIGQYQEQFLGNQYLFKKGASTEGTVHLDGVTKATVSVMVVNDIVLTSAMTIARQYIDAFAQGPAATVDTTLFTEHSFRGLLDNSLITRWEIERETVEQQLDRNLDDYNELSSSDDEHALTLYAMYLNAPTMGRNLLGEQAYTRLMTELKPGEHAFAIMAEGMYDILGPNFREGTIPERFNIEQNGLAIPMRDMAFLRINDAVFLQDMPRLDNFRIYSIRPQAGFNPAAPFDISVHFDLAFNPLIRDKASLKHPIQLPQDLFNPVEIDDQPQRLPLWMQLWQDRAVSIAILLLGLSGILYLFIRQQWFIQPGRHLKLWRYACLLFTTFFIGYYAQGQLSVINIYTLITELFKGFDIMVFVLDPVIFILWVFTFFSLFLFGRGLFCGWLCPFGALQEFASDLGKKLRIKPVAVSHKVDSALRKVKYVILLVIVASALESPGTAEVLAEVEPFKTAITLNFVRYWPFVAYAVGLLILSAFVHKAYCRYLCPLGAGLAILGAFPLFKWLHRRAECGSPCQLCRHKCEIGAIKKTGEIDYLECIQCLECVRIIEDPTECAPQRVAAKKQRSFSTPIDTTEHVVRIMDPLTTR